MGSFFPQVGGEGVRSFFPQAEGEGVESVFPQAGGECVGKVFSAISKQGDERVVIDAPPAA
ncbi:MAG: hypothetical protein KatS3mg110_0425 [Pirellulaceae bacterium]|nr:MAG: hypothetical protein KatS3mg110_0425 [Pirellulaceae bacterium]